MNVNQIEEIQHKIDTIFNPEGVHSFEYPQILSNNSEKEKMIFCDGYAHAFSNLFYLDDNNSETIFYFMLAEMYSVSKGSKNKMLQSGMHYCRTTQLDVYSSLYTHYEIEKLNNK